MDYLNFCHLVPKRLKGNLEIRGNHFKLCNFMLLATVSHFQICSLVMTLVLKSQNGIVIFWSPWIFSSIPQTFEKLLILVGFRYARLCAMIFVLRQFKFQEGSTAIYSVHSLIRSALIAGGCRNRGDENYKACDGGCIGDSSWHLFCTLFPKLLKNFPCCYVSLIHEIYAVITPVLQEIE